MLPENILINGDFIYLSGFNNSFKYSGNNFKNRGKIRYY